MSLSNTDILRFLESTTHGRALDQLCGCYLSVTRRIYFDKYKEEEVCKGTEQLSLYSLQGSIPVENIEGSSSQGESHVVAYLQIPDTDLAVIVNKGYPSKGLYLFPVGNFTGMIKIDGVF